MKNNWQLSMHCDDDNGDRFEFRTDPLFFDTFRVFGHFFKLTGAFLVRVSGASHSKADFRFKSANPNLFSQFRHTKPCFTGPSFTQLQSLAAFFCNSVSSFSIKHLFGRPDIHSLPFLSLAATIIPPLDNLSSNMLAVAPAEARVQMLGSLDQTPCDVRHCGGLGHSFPDLNWIRRAVEPITGIEFPGVLNNILAKENQSNLSSEVLVGTGSRTVTIIKIKSLKVYAFGFYVHAHSVCQKLGSKYASISASELKDHNDFFADLLREDIGMTVRLVVNCNGMKVNAVKDAFEKSLRDRLVKTNPETDFKCISTFGSFFTKDIPLPVGTIIDFRRTADGRLITEIGGNQIGAVHSRELCRAFFDMYLGEVPVSKQTKEEIGSNVASLVRRC